MDMNSPATKEDLSDLEGRFDAKISGLDGKIDGVQTRLRDEIGERVRDAQTEILRGFVAFQNSNMPRMRKMEADLSNINAPTSQRLEVLEERVLEIEKKLIIGNR